MSAIFTTVHNVQSPHLRFYAKKIYVYSWTLWYGYMFIIFLNDLLYVYNYMSEWVHALLAVLNPAEFNGVSLHRLLQISQILTGWSGSLTPKMKSLRFFPCEGIMDTNVLLVKSRQMILSLFPIRRKKSLIGETFLETSWTSRDTWCRPGVG